MPVRGDFCSVGASQTYDKGRSFRVQVAIHRGEITSLDERRPLQILEMYDVIKTITHRRFSFLISFSALATTHIEWPEISSTDGALAEGDTSRESLDVSWLLPACAPNHGPASPSR